MNINKPEWNQYYIYRLVDSLIQLIHQLENVDYVDPNLGFLNIQLYHNKKIEKILMFDQSKWSQMKKDNSSSSQFTFLVSKII